MRFYLYELKWIFLRRRLVLEETWFFPRIKPKKFVMYRQGFVCNKCILTCGTCVPSPVWHMHGSYIHRVCKRVDMYVIAIDRCRPVILSIWSNGAYSNTTSALALLRAATRSQFLCAFSNGTFIFKLKVRWSHCISKTHTEKVIRKEGSYFYLCLM